MTDQSLMDSSALDGGGAGLGPAATKRGVRGHPWLTLLAVSLGAMMVGLNGTVIAVANPTIEKDLHASLSGLQWVADGYLLALVVLLVLGGKLGDRFGRRTLFSIGIGGFALAALGCALSGSIGMLIVCRVFQGIFGAMLMPNTLAILRATFPPETLTKAVGIWAGASALAIASGPIVGGLIVQHISWEAIFLLDLPIGAIALAVTLTVVHDSRDLNHEKGFDFAGLGLLSAGLFLLVWAIIKAEAHGWGSLYTLGFAVAGLVALGGFLVCESRVQTPLLPLKIFRPNPVKIGSAMLVIGFFAMFGVLFFITLYLENIHHYSPVQTGVRMLPLTGMFIASPMVGSYVTEHYGPRIAVIIGMVAVGGGMLGMTSITAEAAYSSIWPWFVVVGFGIGFIMTSMTEAIVGNVPVDLSGVAGGLQSTSMQLGGVLGTAVLGSVLASKAASSFSSHLASVGVTGPTAHALMAGKAAVGSGIAPVSSAMPHTLVVAVKTATDNAFMTGLHTAMFVAAILSFAGAVLGLFMQHKGGAETVLEDGLDSYEAVAESGL